MNPEESIRFILAEGPLAAGEFAGLPLEIQNQYLMIMVYHLEELGPDRFRENKEGLRQLVEDFDFLEEGEDELLMMGINLGGFHAPMYREHRRQQREAETRAEARADEQSKEE